MQRRCRGSHTSLRTWRELSPSGPGLSPVTRSHNPSHRGVELQLAARCLCCPRCSSRTGITPAPLIIRNRFSAFSACLFLAGLCVFIFVPVPSFQLQKAVLPLCYRPPPPAVFIQTNHIHHLPTLSPKNPEVLVQSLNNGMVSSLSMGSI